MFHSDLRPEATWCRNAGILRARTRSAEQTARQTARTTLTFPTFLHPFLLRSFPFLAGLFSRIIIVLLQLVTRSTPTSLHWYSLSSAVAAVLKLLSKFTLLPAFKQTVIFTSARVLLEAHAVTDRQMAAMTSLDRRGPSHTGR